MEDLRRSLPSPILHDSPLTDASRSELTKKALVYTKTKKKKNDPGELASAGWAMAG